MVRRQRKDSYRSLASDQLSLEEWQDNFQLPKVVYQIWEFLLPLFLSVRVAILKHPSSEWLIELDQGFVHRKELLAVILLETPQEYSHVPPFETVQVIESRELDFAHIISKLKHLLLPHLKPLILN